MGRTEKQPEEKENGSKKLLSEKLVNIATGYDSTAALRPPPTLFFKSLYPSRLWIVQANIEQSMMGVLLSEASG